MEPPSLSFLFIYFHPFTIGHLFDLLLILLLLFCSAMISGSEAAYFSLSPNDIQKLKARNTASATRVLKLLHHSDYLLSTILLCNNFVNVAIVLLANGVTTSLIDFSEAPVAGFIFQVIVITFLLLLFGEIMPKLLATRNSLTFAGIMSAPLIALVKITKPVSKLLIGSTAKLNRQMSKSKRNEVSMESLSEAIEIAANSSSEDKKMLKAIVEATSTEVKEIMCPRIDITAVAIDINFADLYALVLDCGYSRIPVYKDSLDSIKGVLYVKDLLPYVHKENDFHWQSLIRQPYFIPENKRINDLLGEFQQKKMHMAIVVDEYGGTSGIITLEDILEEIVGEILDESDLEEDETLYAKLDENVYMFEGKALLNDFCKIMHINSDFFDQVKGEADTLAGFILELKGDIPQKGDELRCGQFTFTIDSVDHRRIQKIKVALDKNEENE